MGLIQFKAVRAIQGLGDAREPPASPVPPWPSLRSPVITNQLRKLLKAGAAK
jgi:hypothetical protein